MLINAGLSLIPLDYNIIRKPQLTIYMNINIIQHNIYIHYLVIT